MTPLFNFFCPELVTETRELTVGFFFLSFSNQGNQVLYIGMLRHCTVIAVKTNITPVSCPTGAV